MVVSADLIQIELLMPVSHQTESIEEKIIIFFILASKCGPLFDLAKSSQAMFYYITGFLSTRGFQALRTD